MSSSWTACIVLAAAFFSAGGVPLKEDPLVTKTKQIITNVNSYLKENSHDQVDLPDLGNLTTDHIQLTNIKIGNFSSMKLVQGPILIPQNQSQYLFYVEIGLNKFEYQFDFDIKNTEYQQQGNFSISPHVNSFIVKAFVDVELDKSCSVSFASVDLYKYGSYAIEIYPDGIPNRDDILAEILDFSSPSFATWFTKAVETLSLIPSLNEELSTIACQVLVS